MYFYTGNFLMYCLYMHFDPLNSFAFKQIGHITFLSVKVSKFMAVCLQISVKINKYGDVHGFQP